MSDKKSILREQSFQFALEIIKLYKEILSKKNEYVMSKQLLRAGTSVGANIREAQNAQSPADFIHKFCIAPKECDETIYWPELLKYSEFIAEYDFAGLNTNANSILKMFKSAILTTKQKTKNS